MVAVYIIKSTSGKYYCGMTNSIIRRWGEHKDGKSKFFQYQHPIEVVYISFHSSYSVARKYEIYIKRFGIRSFIFKFGGIL
jgi:predicted GIY-YIG superfamily endonuclease